MNRRNFISGIFAAAGAMSPAMRALAALSDDFAAPIGEYWRRHLDDVAAKVRARAAECADGFWFITDLHVTANRGQSGKVLAALSPMTPIRKTFCGGDLPEAFAAKFESDKAGLDFTVDRYKLLWRDPIEGSGQLLYTAKGNHDFTIKHDPDTPEGCTYTGEEAKRAIMGSKGCAGAVTNPDDATACYYYVDNAEAKVRYVVADTTDSIDPKAKFWAVRSGIGEVQLAWLAERAIATIPDGWSVVVAHHIPITGCVGNAGERKRFANFRELLEAYQNRGTVTVAGRKYDFKDAKGRIMLDITGHHHAERQTFQNGILHVTEPCDAAYGDYVIGSKPWCGELPAKKRGTVAEQTFDAVQLDPAHDVVYFTRVGGGQDRAIHTKAINVKVGEPLRLAATKLAGEISWGCYDADRIEHTPNPKNRYNPLVSYVNDCATIDQSGSLTLKKPGEIMVVAMDRDLNKEIFPVAISPRDGRMAAGKLLIGG